MSWILVAVGAVVILSFLREVKQYERGVMLTMGKFTIFLRECIIFFGALMLQIKYKRDRCRFCGRNIIVYQEDGKEFDGHICELEFFDK